MNKKNKNFDTSIVKLQYKKLLVLIFVISFFQNVSNSQGIRIDSSGVSINADDSPPHQSAILDIKATNKGLLIPRLSTSSITSPAKGLLIFDSTETVFKFYNGAVWQSIFADNLGNHTATQNIKMNSFCLSYDGSNSGIFFDTNGNVGIGISSPQKKLDIDGGFKVNGNILLNNYWLSGDGDSEGLKITNTGIVAIGNSTTVSSPLSLLTVGGNGPSACTAHITSTLTGDGTVGLKVFKASPSGGSYSGYGLGGNITCGGGFAYGVKGLSTRSTATTTGVAYGIYGEAGNATSGWNYGVYGKLSGTNNGAAIYAATNAYGDESTGGVWAGYFRGNVYINGRLGIKQKTVDYGIDMMTDSIRTLKLVEVSDQRFKSNISNIGNERINKLYDLQGVTYDYDFSYLSSLNEIIPGDTANTVNNLFEIPVSSIQGIGFVAQQVQIVYPEIVSADSHGILSIDYISLIPIIIESIKMQKETLDEQMVTIQVLEDQINMIRNNQNSNSGNE